MSELGSTKGLSLSQVAPAQRVDFEQSQSEPVRKLTEGEIRLAKTVFGDAIDYSKVKIYHKSYLPFGAQPNNVAMAPNGNIYFDPNGTLYHDDFSTAGIDSQALFIHEMTHVYQHQHGEKVILKGIFQRKYGYLPLQDGKAFHDYGIEQRGDIVRDYFYLLNGYNKENLPPIQVYRELIPFVHP